MKQKSPGTDVSEDRLLLLESGAFTGMPDSVAVPLLRLIITDCSQMISFVTLNVSADMDASFSVLVRATDSAIPVRAASGAPPADLLAAFWRIRYMLRSVQPILSAICPVDITRIFSATPEKRKIQCANRQNIPYLV